MISYSEAGVLLALACATIVWAWFYRADSASSSFAGKKIPVPAVKGAYWITRIALVISLVVVPASALFRSTWLLVMWHSDTATAFGAALSALGVIGFLLATRALGHHYAPCFDSFVPIKVAKNGVYARIRHPIYLSNLLVFLGFAVADGSAWSLFAVLGMTVLYGMTITVEEDALARELPEYREYMQQTFRVLPRLPVSTALTVRSR